MRWSQDRCGGVRRAGGAADPCVAGREWLALYQQTGGLLHQIESNTDPDVARDLWSRADELNARGNAVTQELLADPPPELRDAKRQLASGQVLQVLKASKEVKQWVVTNCDVTSSSLGG